MEIAKKENQFSLILILGLLTAIGPLSIDMYLPAFPDIANSLHAPISAVMLSLSSFFIGISAGQLLYGPLLERFGRKLPLYFGLILYAIASVACASAQQVETLIIFRFFQALGGCVGMVAARAMVRDLFAVADNAKIFSTLMLVVAVSPIIAPTLGGYITAWLGWRYIFGVLILVIACIILGVYFLLPESKPANPAYSLKPAAIAKGFISILKEPQFSIYAFTGAIAYAGLYAYISGSPYVFMVLFRVSERQYGWIFTLIAAGLIGASQFNRLLLKKYSSEQIIRYTLYLQNLMGLCLVLSYFAGIQDLYLTIGLLLLFLCCQGCIFPNASAVSMAPFSNQAGNASALMGFIQMSIGALMSALVSLLQNGTSLPMTGIMVFSSFSASILLALGNRRVLKKASRMLIEEEEVEMVSTH